MKKYLLVFGIIFILLASACSQQPQPAAQPKVIVSEETPEEEAPQQQEIPKEEAPIKAETPAPNQGSAEEKTAAPASSVKEFDITAKKFEFIPSTITVSKGDKVKLNVKSIDVAHGFSIPEFKVEENIKPGATKTIEFTADKTGEFTFFCSVYCGTGHGSMKGKLIVE